MKDPHCIALRPQHHWAGHKMRVHVFIWVLALVLPSLLERVLRRRGLNLSVCEILNKLGQIREVAVTYLNPKKKQPTIRLTLSQRSPEQRALYSVLDLDRPRAAPAYVIQQLMRFALSHKTFRVKHGTVELARTSLRR